MRKVDPFAVALVLSAALLATGCGSIRTPSVEGSGSSGASFNGKVMAGGQPVSGAEIQFYAAGTTGNGSAGTSLLAGSLTTDSGGNFTVPADYSCSASTTQVYLVATGGSQASGGDNNSLELMSPLGSCSGIAAGSTAVVNEATTVAAVTALAAFYSARGNIGSTATNTTGLANAFTTATNLVNVSTGFSPRASAPATLIVRSTKLNTLADALTACAAAAANCGPLFAAATPPSGSAPRNTLDAAFDIVRDPANNVAQVFTVASGSSLFSPSLTAAPPDWMLETTLSGGGLSTPTSLGVDASGTVWVADYCSGFDLSTCHGAVSAFAPTGEALAANGFTGGGLYDSWGLAVSASGTIWVANQESSGGVNGGNGTITELSPTGAILTGSDGISAGGISWPIAIAADPNGNIWVVNYWEPPPTGETVTLLNNAGAPLSGGNGWGNGQLEFPVAVAIDASHSAWVANESAGIVTHISADGLQVTNYGCCDGVSGIATDQYGDVWTANYYGDSISVLSTSGAILSNGIKGGGIYHPNGLAIDGAGTAWVANYFGDSLTELAGADTASIGAVMSPSTGFGADASLLSPYGVAIDASGNVWVSNAGNSTVTEFVGIATPIKTPMAGPPRAP